MNPPFNMGPVLNRLIREVRAFDREGSLVDFEYQESSGPTRDYIFGGVLIPPNENDLNLFEEGEIRQGVMLCYVSAPRILYFHDMVSPDSIVRQTYIRNGPDVYRVKNAAQRTADGLYVKYTLVRMVVRD